MEWYIKVLKNYAVFKGRARRKEYWMFTLFSIIVSLLLIIIEKFILKLDFNFPDNRGILESIYTLIILIPTIAVSIRRMHDVGKSGWFMLIPIYNLILSIRPGNKGPNKYGPDPKEEMFISEVPQPINKIN